MIKDKLVFENAEGAETRSRKLNILADSHNKSGLQTMVNDGWILSATTVYQSIDAGGIIQIDKANEMFEWNETDKKLYIYEDGIYDFMVSFAFGLPSSTELLIGIFINGIEYAPMALITTAGRGNTNPVSLNVLAVQELKDGDYLEMKLKVSSATSVTNFGHQSVIQKKIF